MLEVELIFLSIIVVFQIYSVINIWNRISVLDSIFIESSIWDSDTKQFLYSGKNKVKATIIGTINQYILKNEGGVIDFHIINDIVERNVDTIDEEISNKLSTPLYLGLAGTMIGIIIGLFYVDFSSSVDISPGSGVNGDSDDLLKISPLIDGVKYAMGVSVLGLILTTVLSVWIYKNAKSKVNQGKNEFLSQIQTELLPTLIKSGDVAIQELSKELRVFSQSTPIMVNSLKENTGVVKETIEKEINLLNQIKALDVKKLSQSNVEIFHSLSGMMESFQAFPEYYEELNRSLGNTVELNKNLQSLVNSSQNVNAILTDVKKIIETGNSAATFFNQHIKSFETYSDAVNHSISETNQSFDRAIGQLKEAVGAQMEVFNVAIAEYDSKLSKSFDQAIEKYNAAYENALPDFKNLEHLKKLDTLQKSNSTLEEIQTILAKHTKVLENLKLQLPENLNLSMKQEKGIFEYIRDGIIIFTCTTVTTVAIYIAINYQGIF